MPRSGSFILRIKWKSQGLKVVEKLKQHSIFNNFLPQIVPFMRQCGKYGRTRGMRFACVTTKATGTHSEYVILTTFAQQQQCERSSIICRKSTVGLVKHRYCTRIYIILVTYKLNVMSKSFIYQLMHNRVALK